MPKLRLLLKKIFCMVALMTLSLSSTAYSVQLEQISTKEGLNSQEITTLENYADKCLWIGTSVGLNIISNGNITSNSSITVNGSVRTIGRVNDIACYSYNRALIASENFLLEYDNAEKIFRPILYEGKDIITNCLFGLGDYAYLFESSTNSLLRYSFQKRNVSLVYKFEKSNQYSFSKILKPNDKNDNLFLLDNIKGIFEINLLNKEIKKIDIVSYPIVSKASIVDSENNLWVVHEKEGIEAFSIDSGFKSIVSYSKNNSGLDYEYINCLLELYNGDLCVGTDGGGMYIIRKLTGKVDLRDNPYFDETTTMCLIGHDAAFGTSYNGIIIARRSAVHMLNDLNLNAKNKLSNDVALSAYDEGNGIIWIATADGGINRYDEKADVATSYTKTKKMRVHSIKRFDENRLLLGTVHKGYLLFDKRNGMISDSFMDLFKEFKNDLKNDSVIIIQGNKGDYLVFNVEGKNYVYNSVTGKKKLLELYSNDKTGIQEKVIKATECDTYAIISTKRTIFRIDYADLSSKRIYTSEGDYTTFTIDSKGLIWFIDMDKLFSYDPETQLTSQVFNTPNGRTFASLTSDAENNIWLSSIGGVIYRYNKDLSSYTLYTKEDDIPEGDFLRSFAICSSTGRIYFPNTSGLLVIDTNELIDRKQVARNIQVSSIIIDGEPVNIPDNGKLKLPNGYKSFIMEMAVNTQDPTIPVLMRLSMEKDGKEIFSSVTFKPVFSNNMLKSGTYTLKVQTLDVIGWSEPVTLLDLKVKAPLFLTGPMLTLIIIFIVLFIWFIINARYNVKQRKIEQLLYEEATKQKELRISFITNIAHELRTPLSLIYNPLKDILLEMSTEDHDYERLERIFTQVERMTNMVNIILDSSSRSDSSLKNRVETVDINEWVSHKLIEFHDMCDRKRLEMKFEPYSSIDKINIDREVLETALDNVISNAIKYSDSGIITVSIKSIQNYLRISVADQGRGFQCNPEDLFKRFFREDNNDVVGYGLGLPYARNQLENIGGSISAEHNVDVGSIFNIDIPFELASENSISSYIEKENEEEVTEEYQSERGSFNTNDKVLMFVDDDADLREYIRNEYQSLFKTVIVAKDGNVALEKIKRSLPDVIVSDIMMPNMNGFDLCKYIKSNIEYSHLPVILLTSRTDSPIRMTSYKLGADAFLPKPFDFKELYKVIKSQLWNRYEIKRQYSQSLFFAMSEEQTFSAADEQFVLKLNKFINSNLSNLALDIEMISNHMNVSRSTLFNKMNEMLGTSAVKYIRRLRVEAAKKMLENTDKSILEIALDCGFADSQYLSAVFKQETDETPSQYRKRARKEKTV